jgi:hypothetical protein
VAVLGTCIYCGHQLVYALPQGAAPVTDMKHFYAAPNTWYDKSFIDTPLVYGKFCPYAPLHPLGQFAVHHLVA